jgi:gas vesicle protein
MKGRLYMQVIIGIFIGICIGGFAGVVLMCMFQVNRANEDLNYEVKIRKAIDKWKNIKESKQKEYDRTDYKGSEQQNLDKNAIIVAELVADELENIL